MSMQFDSRQKAAITAVNTDILVSASAGAGKTRVLVSRLMKRCTEDKVPLNRILALTFTEAAAGEMKKRLAGELYVRYAQTEDPDEKQYLNEQIISLDNASITTIDSYCLSIIKKYCTVIGLDPAVTANIIDEGTKTIYLQEAFETTLSRYIHQDPDAIKSLLRSIEQRPENFDTLAGIVSSINQYAQAAVHPDVWYDDALSLYDPVSSFQEIPECIRDGFFRALLGSFELLENALSDMMLFSEGDEKIDPEPFQQISVHLKNCENHLREGLYNRYCLSLQELAVIKTSANGKNEDYTAARKKLEDEIKYLLSICYSEVTLVRDVNATSQKAKTLIHLAKDTWQYFSQIKRERKCMDFTDMERFAYDILQASDGFVKDLLKDSFDEIMVDEFQDTSFLQNEIISDIAKKGTVFRVGDVKQSIYAFRQAKPSLMRSLRKDPSILQITLQHNYRSKKSIVAFSNLLFEKIMNIPGFQDTYDTEDIVSIGSERQEEEPVPVVFAALMKKDDDDDETPLDKTSKAEWIAKKIIAMKKENPSLHFRDFAVLLRNHLDKSYLKQVFDNCGIPYDIDTREGFYHSPLAQTILSLSRCILYPDDDISLLSTALSSLYGLQEEEAAWLKLQYKTVRHGIEEVHPEILSDIDTFRRVAEEEGLCALFSAIARTNHFYDNLDETQKTNYDFLLEKASAQSGMDLLSFIENIEAVKNEERSSEAVSKGQDDDVVIVTTIHHSKGLQYPNVFLWSTSQNRLMDASLAVLIDDTLKLGLYYYEETTGRKRPLIHRLAIEHAKNRDDIEESIRLLYVAVTRAIDRLFIVDTLKKTFRSQQPSYALMDARKGMSGMILPVLENNPLFQVEYPDPNEKPEPLFEAQTKEYKPLPVFTLRPKIYNDVVSPSSLEANVLKDLVFKDESSGTDYGTRIHSVIEHLPNTVWNTSLLQGKQLSKTDMEKLIRFSETALYQKTLSYEIYKEYPFFVMKDLLQISGTIDYLAVGEEEVILIDFKTDHAETNVIYERYKEQIAAYKTALEILYPGKKIRTDAYSFYNEEFISFAE